MTALKDINTYEEIHQQPDMWRKVYQQLLKDRKKIKYFKENLFKNDALKIIMVGAGSSEFIGQALKPYLSKKINATIDVLGTTDIVLNPETYLKPEDNLLLISFARSGNSPESLATVDYANKIVKNVYHLVITCNPEGELARSIEKKDKNYDLIMPKETLDKGFAMTSSFTTPLLACALFFEFDPTSKTEDINLIIEKGNDMLKQEKIISDIAKGDFERVIYLGSQSLKGIAQESALKLLELTGGNISVLHDTSLGLRHGPKSFINDASLIVSYLSGNPYTRKYEIDLLLELVKDSIAKEIVVITQTPINIEGITSITLDSKKILEEDLLAGLPYLIFGQLFSLFKSLTYDFNPDDPSPSGVVNRVVKGVTIYEKTI